VAVRHRTLIVIAGMVLLLTGASARHAVPRAPVRPGIDVLLSDSLSLVRGKRVGLVTNIAAVDANGIGDIARLRGAGVNLVALFAPEHGLAVTAAPGERVANGVDSAATPIYSLYGATTAPTDSMLRGLDVILVDLPDVGARYFTYISTTIDVMKAAGAHHIPVVVLDRPDPIGGAIEGNVRDSAHVSPVARLAVPMRHGLTLGEEARLARADLSIAVDLSVVPVAGWQRDMLFPATGLVFRAPSPNLQDFESLLDYPGFCVFEGTALSVGRGTDLPFHQIGAPWLDTTRLLAHLESLHLPGVAFRAVTFTPHAAGDKKFNDTLVVGIRLIVTDPVRYRSTRVALELLTTLQAMYPDRLHIGAAFDRLAGGPVLREAIVRGDSPDMIEQSWQAPIARYRERIAPFLLYR
jgi:uncharacterized protein YbbC (DUF1343 family)